MHSKNSTQGASLRPQAKAGGNNPEQQNRRLFWIASALSEPRNDKNIALFWALLSLAALFYGAACVYMT